MATDIEKKKTKDEPEDPVFAFLTSRRSISIGDIEFQRQFEQNLIRHNLSGEATISNVTKNYTVSGGSTGSPGGGIQCYWELEGSDLAYYEGNVGIKMNPGNYTFAVQGSGYIHNLVVSNDVAAPYVLIQNASNTNTLDPVIKWAVGVTPVVKWTMGVDDSDSDSFVLVASDGIIGSDYLKLSNGILTLSSSSVAPTLLLQNASGTARDPVIQWAVGSTPTVRWTMGVDDSNANQFVLSWGTSLDEEEK